MSAEGLLEAENIGEHFVAQLGGTIFRKVLDNDILQIAQLPVDIAMIIFETEDIVTVHPTFFEQSLHVRKHGSLLVIEMIIHFPAVIGEKRTQDFTVYSVASRCHRGHLRIQMRKSNLQIIQMRSMQVIEDTAQIVRSQLLIRQNRDLRRIKSANHQKKLRRTSALATDFADTRLAEAEGNTHAGKHHEQLVVGLDQVGQLHTRRKEETPPLRIIERMFRLFHNARIMLQR